MFFDERAKFLEIIHSSFKAGNITENTANSEQIMKIKKSYNDAV